MLRTLGIGSQWSNLVRLFWKATSRALARNSGSGYPNSNGFLALHDSGDRDLGDQFGTTQAGPANSGGDACGYVSYRDDEPVSAGCTDRLGGRRGNIPDEPCDNSTVDDLWSHVVILIDSKNRGSLGAFADLARAVLHEKTGIAVWTIVVWTTNIEGWDESQSEKNGNSIRYSRKSIFLSGELMTG